MFSQGKWPEKNHQKIHRGNQTPKSTRNFREGASLSKFRIVLVQTGSENCFNSGKKKEHKPKLLGLDICRWGGSLPREGVGGKKFGISLETGDIKFFLAGYPGILLGYPGGAQKV